MREIKFRAWDKQYGFLYKEINDLRWCTKNGEIIKSINYSPTLITQFTGLKDKNGKEIYEGDIASFEFTDSSNNNLIGKGVIIWMEHESGWGIEEIGNTFFDIRFVKEVIGNIYENKELLEGENV